MTTYLLDSNHASTLVTPGHHVRTRISNATDAGHVFHVTLPVIAETVFGFSILPRAAQNERVWRTVRRTFVIVGMDEVDALDAQNCKSAYGDVAGNSVQSMRLPRLPHCVTTWYCSPRIETFRQFLA